MSPERLNALQGRSRNREYEPSCAKLREEARAFLASPMDPPDQQAGFYHDYFCPQHGVELLFDPARPREHPCPLDGRIFSGEPFDSAWLWFVNNRLSTLAFKLAILWHVDEDETCRLRVEEILSGYARCYTGYEAAPGRPSAQGKATFQSLDEAVWLIPLVRAYDLIRESLSASARALVENELLRPAAEHIVGQKYQSIHNIECWHNAAIGGVGICLDEPDLVRLAVQEEFGFHHQLEEGVLADGLWWEGSTSYHFYALAALISHAQMAEVVDPSLRQTERLQQMFRTPLDLAAPDLRLPATNDCWFFTSLVADVCHGVPPAADLYEVAYGWYEDPGFARVLEYNYRQRPRACVEALLYGRERLRDNAEFGTVGTDLEPSGLALLRSGDLATQNYLLLKYGPHGGGHGHPDKLSLSFYACGHPVAPDLGTPGYGMDLNKSWYRQTLSHNTVVVDGCSQPETQGRLQAFDSGADSAFGLADAQVDWEEAPYEGIEMRRVILWTAGYFIDFFQVECDHRRQIDWVCRFNASPETPQGLAQEREVQLQGDGYEHVSAPVAADSTGPIRLQWGLPQGHVDLFLPCEEETRIIQGQVPFNPAAEQSALLIRRRQARRTSFVALVHPWIQEPVVEEVLPVEEKLPEGVWGLWVHTHQGRDLWVVYRREHEGAFAVPDTADRVLRYVL